MAVTFAMHFGGMEAIKDKLAESCTRAESIVGQQVIKDTAPFVPALTGSLTIRTRLDGNKIIYPGPYARFLYYGKVMVNAKTGKGPAFIPGVGYRYRKGTVLRATDRDLNYDTTKNQQAGPFWDRRMMAAEKDQIAHDLQAYINRRSGI